MKYCSKCGNELMDEAVICPKCGCVVEGIRNTTTGSNSGLKTAVKVFMIIGCILNSFFFFLIPMAWCIPMTVVYFNKVKNGEPISIGFKICSLLFVSQLAGILMFCDNK